jgi:ComF family protein
MPRIHGVICQACGLPLSDGGDRCYSCRQTPPSLLIRAAAVYRSPLQPAIHRFKYAGRKSLQPLFKLLMEFAWSQYAELQPVDLLVPVPLHPSVTHDRGYNQAALLAQALSPVSRCGVYGDLLVRRRRTKAQFRLSKPERLTNLVGAFSLRHEAPVGLLQGAHVLLIDDVCTTGATLQECARALKKGGAGTVKALVLARDP